MASQNDIQDRGPQKRAYARAGLFGALAAISAPITLFGDNHGWFASLGISSHAYGLLTGMVTGILLGAAVVTLIKAKFAGGGAPQARIDQTQSVQRRMLIAIIVLLAGFGLMTIFNPLHHNDEVATDFAIEFALLSVAAAAASTFGVGFLRRRYRMAANDEFVQALRAHAVQLGYLLSIVGLSILYMIYLFRPDLMIVALPLALLIGVMVPPIYFLIAEQRANTEN